MTSAIITVASTHQTSHCNVSSAASVVRLGEHDYADDQDGANFIDFDIEKTVLYPDFKRPEAYHDLALLKLSSKVTFQVSPRLFYYDATSDCGGVSSKKGSSCRFVFWFNCF